MLRCGRLLCSPCEMRRHEQRDSKLSRLMAAPVVTTARRSSSERRAFLRASSTRKGNLHRRVAGNAHVRLKVAGAGEGKRTSYTAWEVHTKRLNDTSDKIGRDVRNRPKRTCRNIAAMSAKERADLGMF